MTKYLDVALFTAKAAGHVIRSQYGKNQRIGRKQSGEEVTETDRAAENTIRKSIARQFPDHGFWGEETGRTPGHEYTWIVDPIDGTTNFVRGIPHFAVSIALAKKGKSVLGVVLNPASGETFWAESGGAFLNGKKIRVRPQNALEAAAMEITMRSPEGFAQNRKWMNRLLHPRMSLKSFGSAALSACYVAAGRLDASFDIRANAYDIAAGAHIAEQAGARVTQANGKPLDLRNEKTSFIIACSRGTHRQVTETAP
ncbi:MAG: inositol monophosphatase [Candidatus Micrarchaeota archaeon]|nr:inositol monophosphatase [Candidatus Micrarchaeota archaeon]